MGDDIHGHGNVIHDLFLGMFLTNFGIRKCPEDRVESHEDRLSEYPGQINRSSFDLLLLDFDVESARVVAPSSSFEGWFWDLRRGSVHEHNHRILPALEPIHRLDVGT